MMASSRREIPELRGLCYIDSPATVPGLPLWHISGPLKKEVVKIKPRVAVEDEPVGLGLVTPVRSVWQIEAEGRNWIGQGPRVQISKSEADAIKGSSDALLLLITLRLAHGGRQGPFAVSPKGMQSADLIPGWGRIRYTNARDALLELGFLEQLHRGGSRPGDASKFKLATPPAISCHHKASLSEAM